MIPGFTIGQTIAGIGIVVLFLGGILFLIGCERMIYYASCSELRDIPIINEIATPVLLAGGAFIAIGMVIHTVQHSGKADTISES